MDASTYYQSDVELGSQTPELTSKLVQHRESAASTCAPSEEVPLENLYLQDLQGRDISEASNQTNHLGGISPLVLPPSIMGACRYGEGGFPSPMGRRHSHSGLSFELSLPRNDDSVMLIPLVDLRSTIPIDLDTGS